MKSREQEQREMIFIFIVAILFFFACSVLSSCSTKPKPIEEPEIIAQPYDDPNPILPKPEVIKPKPVQEKIVLSWENTTAPHPERSPWSQILYREIVEKFSVLDTAKDMSRYCPKYKMLEEGDRKLAWAEFFVSLAYYESGFDPKNYSVDVGTKGDYATYSTGLYQVSAVDVKNYGLKDKLPAYTFKDLLTVEPNIKLALALMERQIKKQSYICVSSGVYWAVISCKTFARYEVNEKLAARLQRTYPKCR